MDYFNSQVIESINIEEVKTQKAFPWVSIQGILTPEGFEALKRDFPSLDLFQYHENIDRGKSKQRPHNRYYAAYERTAYKDLVAKSGTGLIMPHNLKPSWLEFVEELKTNKYYNRLICNILGTSSYYFNLVWHIGISGNEVSPHLDSFQKLGTHLMYFNTSEDWSSEWGGEFLVLEGRKELIPNPNVSDFERVTAAPIIDNCSLLFKNTREAWHGVNPLGCPEGKQRRLANIVFYSKY